ncbi:MAG: MerR family transcriptional regulator [Alphaproteobacteria bacterium]
MAQPDRLTALRRLKKSPSAFRTISEVSEELDVPQHVLRFWETKFAQVRPLKRGGGRRYYRPEDVRVLVRIRELLYRDGYTIKGVQRLFREEGSKIGDAEALESGPEQTAAAAAADFSPLAGNGTGGTRPGAAKSVGAVGPSRLAPAQRAEIERAVKDLVELRDLLRRHTGSRG